MLWKMNELVLLSLFVGAFLLAIDVGRRVGVRASPHSAKSDQDHISTLLAAALGLLALLISFSCYMAVARFDARKTLIVDEANAIGTTWLRAEFLPDAQHTQVKGALQAYVSARLALYTSGVDESQRAQARADTERLQRQLWSIAVAAVTNDTHSDSAALFATTLNDVIDLQEKQQAAAENHVPEAVLWLLLAVSIFSLSLLGYGCGLVRRLRFGPNALLALLIAFVLTTILDIDRPRRGLIEVYPESLLRLQATLGAPSKQS